MEDDKVEEIGVGISTTITSSNKDWNNLLAELNKDDDKIFRFMASISTRIAKLIEQLNINENRIAQINRRALTIKNPETKERFLETSANLEVIIKRTRDELEDTERRQSMLFFFRDLLDKEGHAEAVRNVRQNSGMVNELPVLGEWVTKVEPIVLKINKVYKATSKNINSDHKFVKEYVGQILSLPKENEYRMLWEINPYNTRKLDSISASNTRFRKLMLGDVAQKDELLRPSIIGSAKDLAKTLGLGSGEGLAESTEAIRIYNWFNRYNGQSLSLARNAKANVDSIQFVDNTSANIVNSAMDSLNNIIRASNSAARGLTTDPLSQVPLYFSEVSGELENIKVHIGKWESVISASRYKRHAKRSGKMLKKFAVYLEKILHSLDNVMGGSNAEDYANDGSQDIVKLQKRLNVTADGKLSRELENKLKDLGRFYNMLAKTSFFNSHPLVNGSTGFAVSYENFIKIEEIMKKYE